MITRNAAIGMTLAATVIWAGLSWHWYACTLKNACDSKQVNIVQQPAPKTLTTLGVGCATDYLQSSIRYGRTNSSAQVLRLEHFMNYYQGEQLVLDGVYGEADIAAVRRFQEEYSQQILVPYGLQKANGYVHTATKQMINAIHCAGHNS